MNEEAPMAQGGNVSHASLLREVIAVKMRLTQVEVSLRNLQLECEKIYRGILHKTN